MTTLLIGAAGCQPRPCSDTGDAELLGIELPQLPSNYDWQAAADEAGCDGEETWLVSNTQEIYNRLSDASSYGSCLILEDGDYELHPQMELGYQASGSGGLRLRKRVSLIAQNRGQAILHFGVDIGSSGSPYRYPLPGEKGSKPSAEEIAPITLRGLHFEAGENPAAFPRPAGNQNPGNAVTIMNWGAFRNLQVLDVRIDGNWNADTGILSTSPLGAKIHRIDIKQVKRYGVLLDTPLLNEIPGSGVQAWEENANPYAALDRAEILDAVVQEVNDEAYRVYSQEEVGQGFFFSGSAESALQLGHPTDVRRIQVRGAFSAGVNLAGNATDVRLVDIDVDELGWDRDEIDEDTVVTGGVGIYFEDTTTNARVHRFCVGPETRVGIQSEWDKNSKGQHDAGVEPHPRGRDNQVTYGAINSWQFGLNFNQGSIAPQLQSLFLRNYERFGIVLYNNVASLADWQEIVLGTEPSYEADYPDNIGDPSDIDYASPNAWCHLWRGNPSVATSQAYVNSHAELCEVGGPVVSPP